MTNNIIFAGFGGQGVLFAGKVAAYCGLIEEKQLSWLPSYGPEMRGGTANCGVCISDEPIGSPLVLNPNILIAMNVQSYDKFINAVTPGGTAIVDSSLVDKKSERTDITIHYVPATKMAQDNELSGLANIILLGKMMQSTGFTTEEVMKEAIEKCVPASKKHLIEKNLEAIAMGRDYQ